MSLFGSPLRTCSGTKLYDLLAGKANMESSYVMSKGKALEAFPMLKDDGLTGAVVYYDGAWALVHFLLLPGSRAKLFPRFEVVGWGREHVADDSPPHLSSNPQASTTTRA